MRQSQTLDMLNGASEIRSWLNRGRPLPYHIERTEEEEATGGTKANESQSDRANSAAIATREKSAAVRVYWQARLESSIAAIKSSVSLPRYLLNAALVGLVIGIGLFGLFQWTGYRSPSDRNKVITLMMIAISLAIYAPVHWLNRDLFRGVDIKKGDNQTRTDSVERYDDEKGWVKVDKLQEELRDAREGAYE
ncbi:uncharacterized protein AB675_2788 [Cyphellophora attinorum]|uniref:Uncharacterized protein n=1 Tax=Cyphellophora attinorum TaxID=1664694 RepID=A0A0N1HX35_9EURO|nr:uncharacterized protein AB675_2788 [Phialophora attinorum]KPI44985.1 hypothetical protein AB675_2788 [Phialophora attinorum]